MLETHQQIKDSLLKTASRIWGLPDNASENSFDPLVSILFGACATELEKISHDIEATRGRTLERLVQLLYPEVLCQAIPAHAIAYCYPTEKTVSAGADSQFYYQKKFNGSGEGTPPQWKNIFFSPTANFLLHQATVKLIAGSKSVYAINEKGNKELVLVNSLPENHSFQQSLWLAIEHTEHLGTDALFYFELKNEAGKDIFYDYLSATKWFMGNTLIKTEKEYGPSVSTLREPNPEEIINGKTNSLSRILKQVNALYSRHFITASGIGSIEKENDWPAELKSIYPEEALNKLKEKGSALQWIRIDFPENIPVGTLQEDLTISLNCIPVINSHLIITQQKLVEYINIIPLSSDEMFLDIAEITDIDGNPLNDINKKGNEALINLHFGGIARFNEKDAAAAIEGLIQQLRDESAAYTSIGYDFLNNELKSLQQSLNKLEQQLSGRQLLKGDTPYLVIPDKSRIGTSNIYVKYWTTDGEDGNNIKAGNQLSLYKNADIQNGSIRLVTNTLGGRNNLGNHDKVLAYKAAILSKEKLVTQEDIASFCRLRLALKEAAVEVTRGYKAQEKATGGFAKTIDITIRLTEQEKRILSARGNLSFWEQDLAHLITAHSNFFMPLRVKIKERTV
jgi:hypothetical protein